MPSLTLHAQRLYYEDTQGGGPALVFAHSFLMDGSMFHGLAQRFRSQWRCISWDARGHGRSSSALEPFTLDDVADDLAALLVALGVGKAVVVGVSQGSQVALRFALRHRQRLRALVLMGAQASTEDPQKLPGQASLIDEWARAGLSEPMARGMAHRLVDAGWHGIAEWQAKWRSWTPAQLRQCFSALALRDDLSGRLSNVQQPALLIHGGRDVCVSAGRARALAQELPHAQWLQIPGAGHAPLLTHPGEVEVAMARFLAHLGEPWPSDAAEPVPSQLLAA